MPPSRSSASAARAKRRPTKKRKTTKTKRKPAGAGPQRRLRSDTERDERGGGRRAFVRIMTIHERIRKGGYPNCNALAAELEVDRKTVNRDIQVMKDELRLPIEFDFRRNGYRYTSPVADFPLGRMGREELAALFVAHHALVPLRGTRLAGELASIFQSICRLSEGDVSFAWSELEQLFSSSDRGVVRPDLALFGKLSGAVLETREVRFRYCKLGTRKPEDRRVEPYHVACMDGGWYVFGRDPDRDALRTFALQRMSDVHVMRFGFRRPEGWSIERHLQGALGVWKQSEDGDHLHKVRIRVTGYAARLVTERRWHPSQQVVPLKPGRDGEEAAEVRMELSNFVDVTRWILGMGPYATVLSPRTLRDRVRDQLAGALTNYQ